MDNETRKRLEAVEARLVALESRPVATLDVAETKPKKKANRKELTPEQKLEHVARLRKGKLAAQARREAESKISPQVKTMVEAHTAQAATSPEVRAKADARRDMATADLPEDTTGISKNWDALTIPQRTKIAKKADIEGKVGSSSWEDLHKMDKVAIIKAQNAKAQLMATILAKATKKEVK